MRNAGDHFLELIRIGYVLSVEDHHILAAGMEQSIVTGLGLAARLGGGYHHGPHGRRQVGGGDCGQRLNIIAFKQELHIQLFGWIIQSHKPLQQGRKDRRFTIEGYENALHR